MQKIYKSSTGLEITLRVYKDISDATVIRINYEKPGGSTGYWTATLKTNTSIVYTTQAGQLDEAGVWKLQAYIETPTQQLSGEITQVVVEDTL